jgi:hypothetical protein
MHVERRILAKAQGRSEIVAFAIIALVVVIGGPIEMASRARPAGLPTKQMAIARTPDGRIFVLGGEAGSGPSSLIWVVDVGSRTWTVAGRLLHPMVGPSAAVMGDGRILVTGGCCPITAESEIFDPRIGEARPAARMLEARMGHTLTRLQDGKITAIGGSTVSKAFSSVEVFDPSGDTWSPLPALNAPRSLHAALTLDGGGLLVVGGNGFSNSSGGEIFDPINKAWHAIASYPRESWLVLDAARILSDKIVVAERQRRGSAAVGVYDLRTAVWSEPCSAALPRVDESAVILPGGKVVVGGGSVGVSGRERAVADVNLFDPVSGLWTNLPDLSVARANARFVAIDDDLVLALGGYDGDRALDSSEFISTGSSTLTALTARCGPHPGTGIFRL